MPVDTDDEILGLRTVLRDLVALSAIPAAWVGREPPVVAAGLADALIELLQLDFASVRLRDPSGAGAVDVTRGNAWETFPEWLEGHLATRGRLSRKVIVPDVDGGVEPCRGVVIPIGVDAEGGVVAAACDRSDFPTDIDQLLLSLAANHAATAFQSARLVEERTRAEEDLRKARNELEVKVTERTAELRRSEAYLSEAQRLTQTGSFALSVATGEPTHSSDENSRLFGFDAEHGIPSLEDFLRRIHPEDRARCTETLERGIREEASFEMEYRIVPPQSPPKYIRAIAHPVFTAAGELEEFVGTVMDVTERKRAEEELTASRARVVAAGAEERQRVVRDLHDGAQQRLVHAVIVLKLALQELRSGGGQVEELVAEALDHGEKANFELRELAHGILPGVLTSGGLHAGVEELAKRWPLPITIDVTPERFSPAIEATAYFVVSEALTNAIKHSGALGAQVNAKVEGHVLRVEVRDDGVGGADPGKGSGLTGLRDRVEALGGTTAIASPAGGGTSLLARIPIEGS